MPKVARYIAQQLKAKTVALIYVNNDYGKGGRDAIIKSLDALGVKVIADVSTDQNQIDFSPPCKRRSNPTPTWSSSTPTKKNRRAPCAS